ncbi:MAG: DUF6483 family protein [Anaerolineae bacterium]
MAQKDYVRRLAEQVAMVLAEVLHLRDLGRTDEALGAVDAAYRSLFGLSARFVDAVHPSEILALLRVGEVFDVSRGLALAKLLKQEGQLYAQGERYEQALARYRKALHVVLETLLVADSAERAEYAPLVDELLASTADIPLPDEVRFQIVRYHERSRAYGRAEDALYELLENPATRAAAIKAGRAFYERLLRHDDHDLSAGNLPRPEVLEGLAALRDLEAQLAAESGDQQGDPTT